MLTVPGWYFYLVFIWLSLLLHYLADGRMSRLPENSGVSVNVKWLINLYNVFTLCWLCDFIIRINGASPCLTKTRERYQRCVFGHQGRRWTGGGLKAFLQP